MRKINLNLWVRFFVLIGINIFSFHSKMEYELWVVLIYTLTCISVSFIFGIIKKDNSSFLILLIINAVAYICGVKLAVLFILNMILERLNNIKQYSMVFLIFIITIWSGIYGEESHIVFFISSCLFFINYIINDFCIKFMELEKALDKEIKYNHKLNKRLKADYELQSQSIYNAKLEERNKLSRKVHDEVGHVIAGSLMRLEACKIILDIDKHKGRLMLDEITDNLRNGMENIRNTIHMIAPRKEEVGINQINDLINKKFNETNIEASFLYDDMVNKVTYRQWNLFYDAIKELSTNTIKYSQCSNVKVRIEVLNKLIKFTFKDDGIGQEIISKGYGLIKIEESVLNEGGQLILDGSFGFSAIIILGISEVK